MRRRQITFGLLLALLQPMLSSPERTIRHEEAGQACRATLSEARRGSRKGFVNLALAPIDQANEAAEYVVGQAGDAGSLDELKHRTLEEAHAHLAGSGTAATSESSKTKNASSIGAATPALPPTNKPSSESRMRLRSPTCWFCL